MLFPGGVGPEHAIPGVQILAETMRRIILPLEPPFKEDRHVL